MSDLIDEAAGNPGGKSKSLASQLNADQFDAWQAVGGVRGAIESVLPVLVFVVAYVITMDLKWPLILAGGISVVLILVRLVSRQPVTYSVSGFVGVAIGVIWALWSGRGENFFAFGIITSAAYGLAIMVANLVRYPVVSMALTAVWQLRWKIRARLIVWQGYREICHGCGSPYSPCGSWCRSRCGWAARLRCSERPNCFWDCPHSSSSLGLHGFSYARIGKSCRRSPRATRQLPTRSVRAF